MRHQSFILPWKQEHGDKFLKTRIGVKGWVKDFANLGVGVLGWRNEIRVVKQLGYMCLTVTHVAFDFQCEVQKNFIMTQLLRDVYMKERVCGCFAEEDNRFPLFLKTY